MNVLIDKEKKSQPRKNIQVHGLGYSKDKEETHQKGGYTLQGLDGSKQNESTERS